MKTFFYLAAFILLHLYITAVVFMDLRGDYYSREVPVSADMNPQSLYTSPEYDVNAPEIVCLAENIYHEARDQSIDGMVAVAAVTINRVHSSKYPDSICEVIVEPYQFSWVHQGKTIKLNNSIEQKAWDVAQEIAVMVMEKGVPNDMLGVLYYHADYVTPEWASRKVHRKTIENHIFYAAL